MTDAVLAEQGGDLQGGVAKQLAALTGGAHVGAVLGAAAQLALEVAPDAEAAGEPERPTRLRVPPAGRYLIERAVEQSRDAVDACHQEYPTANIGRAHV